MKLVRVTKKDSVKKSDNAFDDFMDGIYLFTDPQKAIRLIQDVGSSDIGSIESWILDCQKNIPKILAAIKAEKKKRGI